MPTFVTLDSSGNIVFWDPKPFDGYTQVLDYDVICGDDGKPYKAGDEPAPALAGVQAAKRSEINAGFDLAMTASITMPTASPSAFTVYQAIETCRSEDPEGYSTLLTIHEARRDTLLAAVDAATSVEAVQAITVSYAV